MKVIKTSNMGILPVFAAFIVSGCTGHLAENASSNITRSAIAPKWATEAQKQIPADIKNLFTTKLSSSELLIDVTKRRVISTDEVLYRVTSFDIATQASRKFTVTNTGTEIDLPLVIENEREKYQNIYGSIDIPLYHKASLDPSAEMEVVIIYRAAPIPPLPTTKSKVSEYHSALKAAMLPNSTLLDKDIELNGGEIVWRAKYAPIVHAKLSGKILLSKYKDHSLIRNITEKKIVDRTPTTEQSTLDLNLFPVFYKKSPPYLGNDVKVGISEARGDECTIWFDHPYFTYTTPTTSGPPRSCTDNSDCDHCSGRYCRGGVCNHNHGTLVAGMVGHVLSIFPRGAPKVQIFMPNTKGWNHEQDLDWWYDNGVFIGNESWIGSTNLYAHDWYAAAGIAITESSGNGGFHAVTSCGASNTMCVGGYRTIGPPAQMYHSSSSTNLDNCSRWVTGCDRETPHFVFRGEDVTTTSCQPGQLYYPNQRGTSLAAPAGAGLIALMYDRWYFPFGHHTHVVRAALMASANRDIHVPSQYPWKHYSDYGPPDERDGAGVPNALRIENMMKNKRISRYTLFRDSSFDTTGKKVLKEFNLTKGEHLRAVISWTGCPNPVGTQNSAHADIDMHIKGPTGSVVFNAASYDGTYEIADLTATANGNYTIEIQKFGWQNCEEFGGDAIYLGLAYDIN